MSADMFKVIVERPRWGSRHAPAVKLKKGKNDFQHIGLKRHVRESISSRHPEAIISACPSLTDCLTIL
ncbi:hypothetical protein [Sphingomonas pokkalii]|uniref:hypothetical protein n=1 Tax=Sphingomonas pokkalii TaxID=2175090 RepID=UPI0019D159AF|nr:hypothetical protein [Sphingomonas pokkalii]